MKRQREESNDDVYTTIIRLTIDVIQLIAVQLDLLSLLDFTSTCKQFRIIFNDRTFWDKIFRMYLCDDLCAKPRIDLPTFYSRKWWQFKYFDVFVHFVVPTAPQMDKLDLSVNAVKSEFENMGWNSRIFLTSYVTEDEETKIIENPNLIKTKISEKVSQQIPPCALYITAFISDDTETTLASFQVSIFHESSIPKFSNGIMMGPFSTSYEICFEVDLSDTSVIHERFVQEFIAEKRSFWLIQEEILEEQERLRHVEKGDEDSLFPQGVTNSMPLSQFLSIPYGRGFRDQKFEVCTKKRFSTIYGVCGNLYTRWSEKFTLDSIRWQFVADARTIEREHIQKLFETAERMLVELKSQYEAITKIKGNLNAQKWFDDVKRESDNVEEAKLELDPGVLKHWSCRHYYKCKFDGCSLLFYTTPNRWEGKLEVCLAFELVKK